MAADLGTRLIREGLLGRTEVERALSAGARTGKPLPYHVVELGLLDEDTLVRFFRARFPFEEATRETLRAVITETALMVPRDMSEEFGVIAVDRQADTLKLAMVDPSNTHAIDEVAFFTGCYVVPMVARPSDVDWARDQIYPAVSDTAPLRVPLGLIDDDDDAVVELVTRRTRAPQPSTRPVPAPGNEAPRPEETDVAVSQIIALTRPRTPTADDWTLAGSASGATGDIVAPRAGRPSEVPVLVVSNPARPAPAAGAGGTGPVTGIHPIGSSPATAAPSVPAASDRGTLLARLHRSSDRDEVIELAVGAAAIVCRRAAFFVIKKSVAQGWSARGQGVVSGAIRNVWIPISSPSVLRLAAEQKEPWLGQPADTIANGILAAALGGRAEELGVWPIVVRERTVALLYADGPLEGSVRPVDEIVHEVAQAFERIILAEKTRK